MTKQKLFFMLSCLLLTLLFSFQTAVNEIVWSKNYKLKWEDYQGVSKNNDDIKAESSVGFGYSYTTKADSGLVNIVTKFITSESWVDDSSKNVNLLLHEQGHFDFCEIYARMFRKYISTTKFYKATFKQQITQLYGDFLAKCNEEQGKVYDKETNLSRNLAKQKQWNMKIAKRLKELEAYSNTTIKVKLW